ncbi:BC1872 family protein [Neobacillus sp. SCS-31]|uniref:BC1872 family protein n=1 Tax=Neobacillus oceani TaxID=3115292 RepID=UPI003905A761
MDKTEIIARRIMGWKLNRWDRWYDPENRVFIPAADFQPSINLDNAMTIVKRLKMAGYTYEATEKNEVSFNGVRATGATLAEAITEAAFTIADNSSVDDGWF